jgi:hypothetical protein
MREALGSILDAVGGRVTPLNVPDGYAVARRAQARMGDQRLEARDAPRGISLSRRRRDARAAEGKRSV